MNSVKYYEYCTFSAGVAYADDKVCQREVCNNRLTLNISKVKYNICTVMQCVPFHNKERGIINQCEN